MYTIFFTLTLKNYYYYYYFCYFCTFKTTETDFDKTYAWEKLRFSLTFFRTFLLLFFFFLFLSRFFFSYVLILCPFITRCPLFIFYCFLSLCAARPGKTFIANALFKNKNRLKEDLTLGSLFYLNKTISPISSSFFFCARIQLFLSNIIIILYY